jgi:nicotinate phosphoribosyltransferase
MTAVAEEPSDAERKLRADYAARPENSALLTDLYQLNMIRGYLESDMTRTAVFEFFMRRLPERRGFLMAAGLAQVVEYLEGLAFRPAELQWLAESGRFDDRMIDYLAGLRFDGDVDAMPEGTVFFADEPIIRIVAPLPLAQLVETRIINLLHFESMIAAKAARMVLAAPGKILLDFGLRRAHAGEAGMLAARASYLAGFTGTATVPALPLFGIPIFGTMAHSFIQAHRDEARAFEDFARARPDATVFLIDTYDTEKAAATVVALAPRLARAGIRIQGVRIDSGDLAAHARKVRAILDAGGLAEVKIFASGGLDEDDLLAFIRAGAPIDGYGIGTSLTTSSDAAALDCAYKLQEYAGTPRRKKSEGKATWPGRKQVFRRFDAAGRLAGDLIALEDERDTEGGEPLLQPVLRAGRRVGTLPTLAESHATAARNLAALPEPLRRLETGARYPVAVSKRLRAMAAEMDRALVPS